jgi:thiosulfate/3-mercaptopyruvate sulfurtransferase
MRKPPWTASRRQDFAKNVKLLDGGRMKWIAEGRPLTREVPRYPKGEYPNPAARDDLGIRAFKEDALAFSNEGKALIDIRLPGEFSGQITHMPEYPQEGVLRGGHIPGQRTSRGKQPSTKMEPSKSADELRRIYTEGLGLNPSEEIIAYCRIGERSSHTWFALTYLLGYAKVRNYDGSWTEWVNSVRVPIAGPENKRSQRERLRFALCHHQRIVRCP